MAGPYPSNGVILGSGTIRMSRTSDAAPDETVLGGDSRMLNARTPISHAATHSITGSDIITIEQSQVTNLGLSLSLKESVGTAAAAISAHSMSSDPHTTYALSDISTVITYNIDGRVSTVTTSFGTKTMSYDINGLLTSISGTGRYKSKTFTYDENGVITNIGV